MSSHESLVLFIKDVARSLADNVRFGYGSLDEFETLRNKRYPYIWLDPLEGGFPEGESKISSNISWKVSIKFLKLDDKSGNESETATIWDETFELMEQFIHKLDEKILGDEDNIDDIQSNNIEISNTSFKTHRKVSSDLVSGWTVTFELITNTEFSYCSLYD